MNEVIFYILYRPKPLIIKSLNPSSDFILLNKNSLASFHPSIINKKINIKLVCQFLNGKMITKIGNLSYYFYNIDENNLIKRRNFIIR